MKKSSILILTTMGVVMTLVGSAQAELIAYYTFDDANNGGLASVGTDATLSDNTSISVITTAVGAGSLLVEVPETDAPVNSSDGAVSGNDFTWANSTRAVNFWMKADATQDLNPTMISLGSGTSAGQRFDVRMVGGNLRLEVQGGGSTTSTTVGDGNWYNVTVTLGNPATVATTQYYVYDSSFNLVGSGLFTGSATAIVTGDGPLRMGDSYQDTGRDFIGYLDEVRLYDSELTQSDALGLAQLWSPVPEPSTFALAGLGLAGLLTFRRRRV